MKPWSTRVPLVMLLVLSLTGCGAASNSTRATAAPETVHAQWVQALRDNDRATLLALAAESPHRESMVDQTLARMQDYVRNGYVGVGVEGGTLQGVDVLPLQRNGQGATGLSRWRFATVTICYAAALTPTNDGWRVRDWGQAGGCSAA
jgi:hypothetical protein